MPMKKLPEDHKFLKDVLGIDSETKNATQETTMSGLDAINNKIGLRCMTARDIKRILNLSYRQINEWEQRQVRFSKRFSEKKRSWRLFSIEDAFSFAIIQALQYQKIPVSRNQRMVESIRSSNIVHSILTYIAKGRRTFFYHDNDSISGFYVEKRQNRFEKDILPATRPLVIIPLNNILRMVLEKSGRNDFYVVYEKNSNKPVFYLDGQITKLSAQIPINKKPGLEENNK
jgi:hypothetical protein